MTETSDDYRAERIKQALESEDWNEYLFAHRIVDRPVALKGVEDRLSDDEYWKLVRLAWTDADAICCADDLWRELLTKDRPSRDEIMEEDERQALLKLDDPVKIVRGHTEFNRDGWSWTLTWRVAKIFAKTKDGWPEKGSPKVTTARVERSKVIAYFTRWDEEEILIDPNDAYEHETFNIYPGE